MSERTSGIVRTLAGVDMVIAKFEVFVLAYGVLLMAANSIANVAGRFFLSQSIYFSEELNQFLIVLITFVGLGYAARKGRHIRMSAVYDQLSDRNRKILMVIIATVTSVIMFVLAYYAFVYVSRVARLGKVTPSLQLPLYLTYVWVPIGFFITGLQYALTVVSNLRHPDIYLSYEEIDSYDESHQQPAEDNGGGTATPGGGG
jgi:TRAP-type C4-dicarboxylate transport system permease small subunit